MKILGISDSSVCGGATLVEDGQVLASVSEERLDRQKMSTGFPRLSIRSVLERTGTKPEELDRVLVADQYNYFKAQSEYWGGWLIDHPGLMKKAMATLSSHVSRVVGNSPVAQEAYYRLKRSLTASRQPKVRQCLQEEFGVQCPVSFIDHHYCHAASAYHTAGFPDATVITLDGGGDGLCSRVYRVREGNFELLHRLNSYHSIGNYYSYITKICGFTAHKHEGKITGLAAYGQPLYKDLLLKMIRYDQGDIHNQGNCYYWAAVEKIQKALPKDFRIEDVAASIQQVLEDVATQYCNEWVQRSGIGNVALAGGVFANVRLNQRIHELECVKSLFIHPGMGDEGLAFGAAFGPMGGKVESTHLQAPIGHVYFGPDYSDAEIAQVLDRRGLAYRHEDHVERRIAELLSQGYVVARVNGKMEYGPRALGNRSILYHPVDPSVNDWLNVNLHRTEFMPFAPALKHDLASRCFHGIVGAEEAAKFMTITFECTDEMKQQCPGVVHVDGSARPQFVTPESNPSYYTIIDEFYQLTGIPSVINTSFNVHDEPIVCSPDDAVNGFVDGGLDYLAISSFIVPSPKGIPKRHPPLVSK